MVGFKSVPLNSSITANRRIKYAFIQIHVKFGDYEHIRWFSRPLPPVDDNLTSCETTVEFNVASDVTSGSNDSSVDRDGGCNLVARDVFERGFVRIECLDGLLGDQFEEPGQVRTMIDYPVSPFLYNIQRRNN